MALTSPGVQVTVIDESFYTPAEPGTTPLIVIATAENKSNAAGTATAAATTQANAGKAFKVTSQRDLVENFGVPFFEKTASSAPIHGSERNEYGLLAAYSYLGASNSAFIVRANIDLDELEGASTAPGAEPADGKWWVDTQATTWGIQEWNGAAATVTGGQKFTNKVPLVFTNDEVDQIDSNGPKTSVGAIGDYAVVFETIGDDGTYTTKSVGSFGDKEPARIWYKSPGGTYSGGTLIAAGDWVLVGSPEWKASWAAVSGTAVNTTLTTGQTFVINGTSVAIGAGANTNAKLTATATTINSDPTLSGQGISAKRVGSSLYIYSDGSATFDTGGDSTQTGVVEIQAGTGGAALLTALGYSAKEYYPPRLQISPHTTVPQWKTASDEPRPSGSVWIKTTEPANGARWRVKRWSSATKTWQAISAPLYATGHAALYYLDRSGGGVNLAKDDVYVQFNCDETATAATPAVAKFRVFHRKATGNTEIVSSVITSSTFSAGSKGFTMKQSRPGSLTLDSVSVSFTATADATDVELIATAINGADFGVDSNGDQITNLIEASVTSDNELKIVHKKGGEIRFIDGGGTPIALLFADYNLDTGAGTANFYALPDDAVEEYVASNWEPLAAEDFAASGDAPLDEPEDGRLWYNPDFGDVDMMYHNGTTWVGYRDASAYPNSDPNGPQVGATEPTTQSDGTPLVDGDLWISTADLENFPTIYRWDAVADLEWKLIDKTDQQTEEGVLFADARYGTSGATGNTAATIKALLTNNYLDPDAPDPDLYPRGMMLYNTRRSGGNVKRYENSYINTAEDNGRYNDESMSAYATDRWVTASSNNEDGSGSFGRKAQRKVVVSALKSVIDTSEEIRDEERRNFNLIACPGYPETLSNLVNLNIDRGITAFVVGDTPLRLASDATTLTNWGTNAALVTDNGDEGIVTYDEYCAVYYPNGFTTDLSGANAVVPASHMMLRTIALSDAVSYPWFAPAGTRRGGITNATSVGYIDAATGEFQTVALNEGQRDTLYDLKINPIPFFVGVGHVAYGQKTRARNASALDRINVARLTVYLRSQLNKLARPYIFEPNDKITRDEIKQACESLLLELVSLRALYDFAVVCDESNNTDSRIDRNELWVDIAIEPVKAVEFIYIPLRIKNTGEI